MIDHQITGQRRSIPEREPLGENFRGVRAETERLCQPLETEDYVVQTMDDMSPPKWHLAHVTWFFESFVLGHFLGDYRPVDPNYAFLFNSYYQTVGPMHSRALRGQLTRPTVAEIYAYRRAVDERITQFIASVDEANWSAAALRIELGLHHEQQHQELLLMDIKHLFASNPLLPTYLATGPLEALAAPEHRFVDRPSGIFAIGCEADQFCFDNETPRHDVLVAPHQLGNRCVTNREYLAFMNDGGYQRSELWLADGWNTVCKQQWQAPMYWQRIEGAWHEFRLAGLQPINPDAPVVHVSHYEADAYARWAGARLPTEAEWELAAADLPITGNFSEAGILHPRPANGDGPLMQLFGDVWELTRSPYAPYPGYAPLAGALGEYNGKFMSSQVVLRGGSCATPRSHVRASYRNFFYPHNRWAFQGFRMARDA